MSLPCLNPLESSFSLKKIQTPFPGFQGPTDLISIHFSDRISFCFLSAPHCFTASGAPSASHVPSQLCTCLFLYSSLGRKVTSSGRPSLTTSLLLSCKPTTLFSLAVITVGYFFMRKGSCIFVSTSTWKVLNKCVG